MIGALILGLVAGFIGRALLGIGDDDAFDWGGILSAVIGVVIVLVLVGFVGRRINRRAAPA